MTEHDPAHPTPLGIYDKPGRAAISGIEVIAGGLSAVWLIGAAIYFVSLPKPNEPGANDLVSLRFVITILAIFMPVAMIWVAATAARSARVMREESQRLQSAIDAVRQTYVLQNQNRNTASEPSVTRKLGEIAAANLKTAGTAATFSSRRDSAPEPEAPPPTTPTSVPEEQTSLAFERPASELGPLLNRTDFIRALNFPENAEDIDGFDALRKALLNRSAAQLIQSAQDVLTLLSQDGIYMDDLRPDMARPEIWRQFAHGARGRSIAALGGVRDRSSLALTSGRMKQDPIFRDTAHHFLRIFDKMFTDFEETATDSDISELSETRTARAFMLLGRVTGTFD